MRLTQMAKRHPDECDPDMAQQVEELIQRLEKERSITMKDVSARAETQGNGNLEEEAWEDLEDGDEEMT